MSKGSVIQRFFLKVFAVCAFSMTFSSCSSNSSSTSAGDFDHKSHMSRLELSFSNCEIEFLSNNHPISYWQSNRASEAEIYPWIEETNGDYYQLLIDDPEIFRKDDLLAPKKTEICINNLANEIERLALIANPDAKSLSMLYESLIANRQEYLISARAIAALKINETNRAKYLELEDKRRDLTRSKEAIFYRIRELIDFDQVNSTRIYVERCPDAFSVFGSDTVNDGSLLLSNVSSSDDEVNFTVSYKGDDGIFVGETPVNVRVPANSKLRVSISASGSAGPVTGGAYYPKNCSIQ
jgi:hypothetical protein